MATKAVAAAPEAISEESAKTQIADRPTQTQAVVDTTHADGTTTGNAPSVAGEFQQDAKHISPASADKIKSPHLPATRPQPENDASSVPPAEVLPRARDTNTHPSDPSVRNLTSEQANALFPTENYGAYTAEELHNANIENFKEGERLHGKFTAHLYDRVLPALNESIKRLKAGEVINGYSGERQVGAYLESIGYSADLVRQWNKRYRDRMADLKKALGFTDGSGDSKLTPDQRELRDVLMQQGYKNPEATRLAKAAEGTSLIDRFNWVMAHRANEINGAIPNEDVEGVINTATEESDPEPGSVTTVTHTDAVATPAEAQEPLPVPTGTLAPETATFDDWQNHQLPAPEFKLKYFSEASENFSRTYLYSFQKSGFKKIIEVLRDKPDQVRTNATDFAQLANVLRGVAENANLLAAAISTALTLSPGPLPTTEPEEQPEEQNAGQHDPDLTVLANEETEPETSELNSPTPAAKPDAGVVSTTKVGDKSEPTLHGFFFEMRLHEKLPYVVRDTNNPNLGILCECKNKADAEMKVATYEREAAEAIAAAVDGADDVPQVCEKEYSEEEVAAMFMSPEEKN
jgi:hypothetical protein